MSKSECISGKYLNDIRTFFICLLIFVAYGFVLKRKIDSCDSMKNETVTITKTESL